MSSIHYELQTWAQDLPYWQQLALSRIIAGEVLDSNGYEELLQYLLEDAGLTDQKLNRPVPTISGSTEFSVAPPKKLNLKAVRNASNVNGLVANQELQFGQALTVVFGDNGAGKSSYTRLLANAAFSRGIKEVLPNLYGSDPESSKSTAEFEVSDGKIDYVVGESDSILEGVYVFDSASVEAHLVGPNSISFSPAGLLVVQKLAQVTQDLHDLMKERIEQRRLPKSFAHFFAGDSEVSRLISNLNGKTNKESIKNLCVIDPTRKVSLESKIAALVVADPTLQIRQIDQQRLDVLALIQNLRVITLAVGSNRTLEINSKIALHRENLQKVNLLNLDRFCHDALSTVGSDTWQTFVRAAHKYAIAESHEKGTYPEEGDICLLCQQELSEDAQNLLKSLWEYLSADAQRNASASSIVIQQEIQKIRSTNLTIFSETSACYRFLSETYPELAAGVKSLLSTSSQRLAFMQQALETHTELDAANIDGSCLQELESVVSELEQRRSALQDQNVESELIETRKQLLEVTHAEILTQHLRDIEEYIDSIAWADAAEMALPKTRDITKKHNELFNSTITEKYVEIFKVYLRRFLHEQVRVEIKTIGKKGDTLRQIVLFSEQSRKKHSINKVLSDGEQRAVALSDFLTEATLDESCSVLVLDDPVTSFGTAWRNAAAQVLVEQAKEKQVVVFCHDLPFVYNLKESSQDVDMQIHWIKRGDLDGQPGYVYLHNGPANEEDYKNARLADDLYARALKAPPQEQELLLKQGFGALRSSYEAFVIFDLLKGAVRRWDERVRMEYIEEIKWDPALAKQVVVKVHYLSRFIEAHLHSDAFQPAKPTPALLHQEIEEFKNLRKSLKQFAKGNVVEIQAKRTNV